MAAAQGYQKKEESWGRYDFLGIAKYIPALSMFLVVISLIVIFTKGLNYGVDFAGGIEVQAQFNGTVEAASVRKLMSDLGFPHANVQALGDKDEYLIHVESIEGKSESDTNQYIQDTINKVKA